MHRETDREAPCALHSGNTWPENSTIEKKFVRCYATIPAYECLSEETRDRLREADRLVRERSQVIGKVNEPEPLAPSSDRAFWAKFEHELSFVFPLPSDAEDSIQGRRTADEELVALNVFETFQDIMAQPNEAEFLIFLQRCCIRFALSPKIRQHVIRTTGDRGGYVQFPPAEGLRTRFAELFQLLRTKPGQSALFRSLVAMVLITNAHAFSDGNGRLSRVLFNLDLWREHGCVSNYFPWIPFFSRSRGGTVLRVRQAEIHGVWDDLALQLCAGIEQVFDRPNSAMAVS